MKEKLFRIGIIGGHGKFGAWFCSLFRELNHEVHLCDVGSQMSQAELVGCSDVILVCTPIEISAQVIDTLCGQVVGNQLVVDIVSVKEVVKRELERLPSQVLSIHPLFSPAVGALDGQTVVVSTVRSGPAVGWFIEQLEAWRLKVVETTLDEHDQLMAVVQGLTHFISVALAATLECLEVDPSRTLEVTSPVYRIQLDLVGRIMSQQMELYRDIALGNSYNREVLATFMTVAKELEHLIKTKDAKGYGELFQRASKHFGSTAERCFRESNHLVDVFARSLHGEQDD